MDFIVYSRTMNSDDCQRLKEVLNSPKRISIVTHRNPDGDAYGSSLALYFYLMKLGHEVHVVSPNDCPAFLKWMPGQDDITIFEHDLKSGSNILENSEVIFALDFNALHRLGDMMGSFMETLNPFYVMIDHHQEPDDFADISYVDPTICSTSQMVYHFMDAMGDLELLDDKIATCLYTGILTDTGSFRFPATDSTTHRIVADLLDHGANNSEIYRKIHDVNTYDRLQLLSRALYNLVVLKKYHTAYITLSQNELNRYNFQRGDTEGFVNYALSLRNVSFAAIFIEDKKQKIIKISFRSSGTFSVNEFARKHFNGGGHINAAGGRSEDSLQKTVENFKELLPDYIEELKASE
ncbi:MAG: bifunctional oligoribonuclease/PAP phosphatase NrnA [Lutimonas sp.]